MKPINHWRRWGEADDRYLEEKWGIFSVKKIAEKLGRTECGVWQRANKLGLGSYQEAGGIYISPPKIAELLGKSIAGVYYWIKTGKLPSKKRKRNDKVIHQISVDDLLEFLEKNQDLWDSSKLELYGLGEEPKWLKEKRKRDINKSNIKQSKPWTKIEDNRLLEYIKEGLTTKEIARRMNRTIASVDARLSRMRRKGESIPRKKIMIPWTDKEIKIMLELEKKGYTDKKIAYELGREMGDISHKRYKLRKEGKYKGYKYQGKYIENGKIV